MKVLATALVLSALATGVALGGATTPSLVLSSAVANRAGAGASLTVEGTLDFSNALELGYPIDLLVFQGATFTRFPFAGTPMAGTTSALADGVLAEGEIPTVVAAGTTAPNGVRVITLVRDSIRVALPPSIVAGPATAIVFGILTDGTVLSNPIDFVVP